MSDQLATQETVDIIERVVMAGDLGQLSPTERVIYYRRVCDSLGLNPYTRPFAYIKLQGGLMLYARKDATDQLRKIHSVSIAAPVIEYTDDLVVVTVTGSDREGRTDTEVGAVSLRGLQGEARANAIMKALTKAKRRLTLSIVGLGWSDETEIETIPGAEPVSVDFETGQINGNGHDKILRPERQPERPPEAPPSGWASWPENGRRAFWAKANEYGLDEEAVHVAFGVESMKDYAGSMADAKAVLTLASYVMTHGLTIQEAHLALDVDCLADWTGSYAAAVERLAAFVAKSDAT